MLKRLHMSTSSDWDKTDLRQETESFDELRVVRGISTDIEKNQLVNV
jgi:hypothetical protein